MPGKQASCPECDASVNVHNALHEDIVICPDCGEPLEYILEDPDDEGELHYS